MGFVQLWDKLSIHRYFFGELKSSKIKEHPQFFTVYALTFAMLPHGLTFINYNLSAFVNTAKVSTDKLSLSNKSNFIK